MTKIIGSVVKWRPGPTLLNMLGQNRRNNRRAWPWLRLGLPGWSACSHSLPGYRCPHQGRSVGSSFVYPDHDGKPLGAFSITCVYGAACRHSSVTEATAAPKSPGRRLLLALGNARYHYAKLPQPYSPQLTPIERAWKLTRRLATHNHYFDTLPQVLKVINACFDRWRRPNDVLRRLFCVT